MKIFFCLQKKTLIKNKLFTIVNTKMFTFVNIKLRYGLFKISESIY